MLALLLSALPATGLAQVTPFLRPTEPAGSSVVFRPSADSEAARAKFPLRPGAGPVALHPHAVVRVLRGEGFALGALPEQETSIQTLEPGLLARIGRRWRADATATWTRYSNRAFTDTFDSAFTLSGDHAAGFWRLQEQARFESSTSLLMETAAQTRTRRGGGGLSLERDLGLGRLLEVGLDHARTCVVTVGAVSIPVAPPWDDANARLRFTRQLSNDLKGTLLFSAGQTSSSAADSRQTRPGIGLRWHLAERFQVGAEISRETREFKGSPGRVLRSDLGAVRCEYAPAASTRLTLEAARSVSPSLTAGEVNREGLVRAGLRQRLLSRLQFDSAWVRRHQDYLSTAAAGGLARRDRSRTLDLALSCALLRRLNFTVLHRATRNTSSLAGYGFSSRQYGAELSARF